MVRVGPHHASLDPDVLGLRRPAESEALSLVEGDRALVAVEHPEVGVGADELRLEVTSLARGMVDGGAGSDKLWLTAPTSVAASGLHLTIDVTRELFAVERRRVLGVDRCANGEELGSCELGPPVRRTP